MNVAAIVSQVSALRLLKKLRKDIFFPFPCNGQTLRASIVVFLDAGRNVDFGQLSFPAGILFGTLSENSVIHTVSWVSHKS